MPEKGNGFTEFYILGANGKAEGYPKNLKEGDTAAVIVGVINGEHAEVQYRLFVKTGDVIINKIEPITPAKGHKWEQRVSFIPTKTGDNQKVEFLLYKDAGTYPYLSLNLRIDVK